MDDTSSLPTTNIINLSYDRSKFFLVFFFLKKKNRSSREKTCKEVESMERTQQRIKLKQLKVIVYEYHLCHTLKWGEKRRRQKGKGQRRKKVRSRRGQPCRKKRLLRGKCRVPKGKSINEHGSNRLGMWRNAKCQVTQTKLPLTYSWEGMSDIQPFSIH